MINNELIILLSALSLSFGIYSGVASIKRNNRKDTRRDASDMAMVIVKLEDISLGISEIKSDLSGVKGDIKEITERLIVCEQSVKLAHRRLNELNKTNYGEE